MQRNKGGRWRYGDRSDSPSELVSRDINAAAAAADSAARAA